MPSIALSAKLLVALSLGLGLLSLSAHARPQGEVKALRHVVLFKFKETTSPADKKKIEDAFRALPAKISEIRSFEWGANVSVENRSQGFTDCFVLTFASEKDRDTYLVHPAHKEFGNTIGGALEKVLVVDFWAEK